MSSKTEAWLILPLSAALVAGSWLRLLPIDFVESIGFATGAVCVWLVARENLWNWPVGIANNLFFALLFWRTRLFADMGLQAIYLLLGLYGWWQWLRGGTDHSRLTVSRTLRAEWAAILVTLTAGTWALMRLLILINGAAPFWDSLTTTLSLCAQYLLCRKRIENWFLWIAADLIYVPLYSSKGLPLTAVLYGLFIGLCVMGLRHWRSASAHPAASTAPHAP